MKSFFESFTICLLLSLTSVFSCMVLGFLLLGEDNFVVAIVVGIGLLVLLVTQGVSKPTRLGLTGVCLGVGIGMMLGAWWASSLMDDSILFIQNYHAPPGEFPAGAAVLSVFSLLIGWASYGISALVRRKKAGSDSAAN